MWLNFLRQLTAQATADTRYSYGWHRAEILAALVNGVFLLALCFSISLEAIERFFSTPGRCDVLRTVHIFLPSRRNFQPKACCYCGLSGSCLQYRRPVPIPWYILLLSCLVPTDRLIDHDHSHDHAHSHPSSTSPSRSKASSIAPIPASDSTSSPVPIGHPPSRWSGRDRSGSYSSLYGHPAATRASFVQTAHDLARSTSPKRGSRSRPSLDMRPSLTGGAIGVAPESDPPEVDRVIVATPTEVTERTPLLPAEPDSDNASLNHTPNRPRSHASTLR